MTSFFCNFILSRLFKWLPVFASLLHHVLLPSRNSHPGTFPTFPVSLPSGRQSNVSLVVKASGGSSESSTSLTVFKSVQNVWDQPEDRLGLFGLGFAAVAAFWASTNLVAAIDQLPLFPAVFELIGIFYSVVTFCIIDVCFSIMSVIIIWKECKLFSFYFSGFTLSLSSYSPDREELFQILNKSATDILGQ
ncbi:LOW QUALITY PROTEIN: protein CURVATURE THYLAKOID 1C, chloroplastic-like [Vigna umbellata]|uniref:LOW QUALITY PROTEIN: protein CURVATURE THYLAKOID 1C, chloroplastic-like n=1 Tax=Vigna umbellata TaxID=87088 RepID=UPI001F5E455F|nr:LOW QUALITY PROTEIN: protein CURVATURE THYLAKOID 1C, chloroplastic-like [Vigna umbellata]